MNNIRFLFLFALGSVLLLSCNDFDDDNIDFSNSVNPYVEFNSGPTRTLEPGQSINLPVVVRTAIQSDLTVSYTIEGDINTQSEVVISAKELSSSIAVPSLGDGVEGQVVVTIVAVDNSRFSIGRGDSGLGLSTTQVTINWVEPDEE